MAEGKPQCVYLGIYITDQKGVGEVYREKGDFMKIIAKYGCFSQLPLP